MPDLSARPVRPIDMTSDFDTVCTDKRAMYSHEKQRESQYERSPHFATDENDFPSVYSVEQLAQGKELRASPSSHGKKTSSATDGRSLNGIRMRTASTAATDSF